MEKLQVGNMWFFGRLVNKKWHLRSEVAFSSFKAATACLWDWRERGLVGDDMQIISLHTIVENCVPDDNHGITI